MRDAASDRQVLAADPGQSTWLSANAGSGKTRVLIDRVARLLLAGTEPQRVLCLTYTNAAAAEMQNRLSARLGQWAMLPEGDLRAALRALGVEGGIAGDTLARARQLFARAIETPGGLKIQTIHSFCNALLRRFPLEARVSPGFRELDDRSAELMRGEIVEELAAGLDRGAVDALAAQVASEDLGRFLADLGRHGDAFAQPLDRDGALRLFGLPAGFGAEALRREVLLADDAGLLTALTALLLGGSANDLRDGQKLAALSLDGDAGALLGGLEAVLLYGSGAKRFSARIGAFPTKGLAAGAAAPLMARIEALMARVEAARPRRIALAAAERTAAIHRFAGAFVPLYRARKSAHGWLDFDDLITFSARLLSDRAVAAWVLYRLDGGIDHILVDEAQDTSPAQWQVIERLAEEFTAGEGARGQGRTIFVVGDKKQSIYSFQGADLEAFDRMQGHFAAKFSAAGSALHRLALEHSFRSSDAVLRVVDLTFDDRVNRGLGGAPKHIAFHHDRPGRVDLWAALPKTDKVEPDNWYDPVDLLPEAHHMVALAEKIAAEIRRMIDSGVQIPDEGGARPLHEGDFLILVQRRSDLFEQIIRACKAEGLAIAGADRLKLGAELAVRDLAALMAFLATPEDDLSLAAALRSPLFGWSEAALYDLAQSRPGDAYLWAALRGREAEFPETLAILHDLRDSADFLRPFELIERVLIRHDGRRRLLARLGPEAEDGIDALLAQAMAYEQSEVPSLTGFLAWMDTGDTDVKRRLDTATRAVRVMTVHGAKGLESPIVILPDTAKRSVTPRAEILRVVDGDGADQVVWRTTSGESPELIASALAEMTAREAAERMRLLYVAMTRAESWLIVCAAGDTGTGDESWHALIDAAMDKAGAVTALPDGGAFDFGPGKRVEIGTWPADGAARGRQVDPLPPLPDWAVRRAPMSAEVPALLSPSGLGGAKALPGEAGLDEAAALRRGSALHLLLEHLPLWPEADWPGIAECLVLSIEDGPDPAGTEPLLAEARRILTTPSLAPLFAPGTLAEVELTATVPELGGRRLQGAIDRLLIATDHVLAVDYKSNAVVPATVAEVPEGILRQMGAYAAMLAQIYSGRRIETAILWTTDGRLMPLPRNIVRDALAATPIP